MPKTGADMEQGRIISWMKKEGDRVAKGEVLLDGLVDAVDAGADLVIVNTCGFIDEAVAESLDAIGEALAENGKVIVTGCLGAKAGESGASLVACQMSMELMGIRREELIDGIQVGGVAAYLEASEHADNNLFI